MVRRLWSMLTLAVVALLIASIAGACGGGDGEENEVEDAIRAAGQALKDGNIDAFLAAYTDKGIEENFEGLTREEASDELGSEESQEFISGFELREVSNVQVSGDTATAEILLSFGKALEREKDSLIKDGGIWKFDGVEELEVEVPAGVTAVDVQANEFAFGFNPTDIEDGNVAFRLTNAGEQPHMLFLTKVTGEFDIEEAIQAPEDEDPEGIEEDIGGTDEVEPGDTANLVFTGPLGAGRYVMVCFVEDPDSGKGHVELGMHAEFTIE